MSLSGVSGSRLDDDPYSSCYPPLFHVAFLRGNILIMPEEKVGPVKRSLGLLGLRTPKVKFGLIVLLYLYLELFLSFECSS